jgi:hypothetical protein
VSDRADETSALITSFGTGSTPLEVARAGTQWTVLSSSVIVLVGLVCAGLGLADGNGLLVAMAAGPVLLGCLWLWDAARSHRNAQRLSRRSREGELGLP